MNPRLCFISHMVGRRPGYIPVQGQILSGLFKDAGYSVIAVSDRLSRSKRMADVVSTLVRRRNNIDVLIIDIYGGLSFVLEDVASLLGRRFDQKVVMWLHGGAMPAFMAEHPDWTRRVLSRADLIVAPSEFLARAIVPYGFQARVIPNVIDLSDYHYRHRQALSPRLFWMRSIEPLYNPELAIRVLARLRSTMPEASLVLAGPDKGLVAELRQLVEELGLNGAVRFAGFLDRKGKAREGDQADIFLNTSRVDNMPVAIVEACAMGLPVVTTAVGGIPDLLADNQTGLLVPDNNEDATVEAINRLLGDPDLAGRLSANGRQLAESSSWVPVRLQWEQVFAQVMTCPSSSQEARL